MMDLPRSPWRKSSRSGPTENCVEVALAPDAVGVRDSKNPQGDHLTLPTTAWRSFTTSLKQS